MGRRFTIPQNCAPVIRAFFSIMNASGMICAEVSEQSGIGQKTIYHWRHNDPGLQKFIAALNTLGYDLEIVELVSRRPYPIPPLPPRQLQESSNGQPSAPNT